MSGTNTIPEAANTYLAAKRVDEVECVIADLPRIARAKALPASKWHEQSHFHLPIAIFFQTITGNWGEAAGPDGFREPDMVISPWEREHLLLNL